MTKFWFYYNLRTLWQLCEHFSFFFSADTPHSLYNNGIGRDSKKMYILCKFFGIFTAENRKIWFCIRFAWGPFLAGWVRVNIVGSVFNIIHSDRKKSPPYDVSVFIESLFMTWSYYNMCSMFIYSIELDMMICPIWCLTWIGSPITKNYETMFFNIFYLLLEINNKRKKRERDEACPHLR